MSIRAVKRTGLYKHSWLVMFDEYLSTAKRYIYVKMCKNCGTFIYTKNHLYTANDIEFIENQSTMAIEQNKNGYCPTCYKMIRDSYVQFEVYPIG